MREPFYIESLETERKYQRLASLEPELKIPIFECYLEIKITLPGEEEPIHWHKQRSHSWTRNAYNFLACMLMGIRGNGSFAGGGTPIKTTGGAVVSANYLPIICRSTTYSGYTSDPEVAGMGYAGAVGDANYGIVAGIGVGAENFEDYAPGAVCSEGTGVNQLNYMAMAAPAKSWDGPSRTLSIVWSRYINNNSSGTINIGELALIARAAHNNASTLALVTRDVLGAPVAVPASGQILASYTMGTVYP